MKRRQFGAMLATAAVSLGSVGHVAAETTAQSTDPLEVEDVSTTIGGATATVGRAALTYEESTMTFEVSDWRTESDAGTLSTDAVEVVAEDVSAETYDAVRSAMVEAYEGQSMSPLLTALAEAEPNPESPVAVTVESVETDEQVVADGVTATGTVRSVVPEGTRALAAGDASMSDLDALGSSEWSQLTVERGDAELAADDVVMELDGAALAVTSPEGTATAADGEFEFAELEATLAPPETIPSAHVEFASQARELAADGELTASAVESAAADAGVTVSNTAEAVRSANVEIALAEVTEGGETVVSDFATSGTVAELLAVLDQQA